MGDPSVTPSVGGMGYQRLAYDDAATTDQMATDCAEVGRALRITEPRPASETTHPHDADRCGTVEVSDDLAALAGGLQLHFD